MKKGNRNILVFIIVLGMLGSTIALTTFAKPRSYIDGMTGLYDLYDLFPLGQSGSPHFGSTYGDTTYGLEVYPGEELRIPLTADMFTWSDGRTPLPMESVLLRELRTGRVSVRTHVRAGSETLDYVQLDRDTFYDKIFYVPGRSDAKTASTAYISIMFTDKLISVKEVDFQFQIYLSVDGDVNDNARITVEGTMKNPTYNGDYKLDYVNISDGTVLEADTFSRDVEIDVGKGITIKKNLFEGKKYYGITGVKPATDPKLAEKDPFIYPSIVAAYKIEGINLNHGSSKVTIDPKNVFTDLELLDFYYVYNEDMKYLGTTKEELPYSDFYFIANEKVETLTEENYQDSVEAVPTSREEMLELQQEGLQVKIDKNAVVPTKAMEQDALKEENLPLVAEKSVPVVEKKIVPVATNNIIVINSRD